MTAEQFLDGKVTLHSGDCLDVLPTLEANSIDACVTDPPYHLQSIHKRFAAKGRDETSERYAAGPYGRTAKGFMGKQWDGGDIAFRPETWAEVYRVLKPGAHLVAFGGTRTFGRMQVAIEEAGFEIRDCVMWLYGSGFPKSHDVSKGIDRHNGDDRPVIGQKRYGPDDFERSEKFRQAPRGTIDVTSAASAASAAWEGFGTALKPACEPIVLARKPLSEGTVAANVLKWGTGALNIDGCRIEAPEGSVVQMEHHETGAARGYDGGLKGGARIEPQTNGRWPANVIHDGSPEVVEGFPESEVSGTAKLGNKNKAGRAIFGGCEPGFESSMPNDSGSAARFFYQAKSDVRCQLCSANIVAFHSKTESIQTGNTAHIDAPDLALHESAGSDHRSPDLAGSAANRSSQCRQPEVGSVLENAETLDESSVVQNVLDAANLCVSCATAIAQELVEVRRSGKADPSRFKCSIGGFKGTILSRSLASYVASRENTDTILTTTNLRELFGCVFHAIAENISSEKAGSEASTKSAPKRLWYSSKADSDDRLGSKHPTVKPLDLMQWLVRLVTPPRGTVLDCFSGTGTTGEAAFREGMRAILIEREEEYQNDIRRRMKLVMSGATERTVESIKARMQGKAVDHGPLFDTTRHDGAGADRYTATSPIRTDDRTDRIEMVKP